MSFHLESRNYAFSHSVRTPKIKHKFNVGELVFIKMENELCLVFIHYISHKLVLCTCNKADNKIAPTGISAIASETIYHDYRSHQLYYQTDSDDTINLTNLHGYYIPMYFISFPGYRKKCSKLFRFWVKECDIIPYYSVRKKLADKKVYKLDDISHALKQALSESQAGNIDNYVYNLKHRHLDISKPFLNDIDSSSLPWDIGDSLKKFMNEERKRIIAIDWGMDPFCNFIWQSAQLTHGERVIKQLEILKHYSNTPFYRKFSARSIANEFKFYVLLLAKILIKTDKKNVKLWNKQIKISYQCFAGYYMNQLYWIDLLIDWFDKNFIDTCCYCKEERLFLNTLLHTYHQMQLQQLKQFQKNGNNCGSSINSAVLEASLLSDFDDWKMKPSDLLGASHLARLLCYSNYYDNFLSKLCNDGVRIECISLPIYQLFIYFLSYSLRDYTMSQDYCVE